MNKNPFSFYDFLGYLFPGVVALALVIFVLALHSENAPVYEYFSINKFIEVFQEKQSLEWWESTIIVIILSYVAGHIVAYLSSIIIENFANNLFGYPSYYLLHYDKPRLCLLCKRYWIYPSFNLGRFFWRLVFFFMLSPIVIVTVIIGVPLRIVEYIVRPLDEYVRNSIQGKLMQLSQMLNLELPDVNSKADYHRIVMHYVYLNIPNCQRKADNYVAIYGFLRAMTLIACTYFDYLLFQLMRALNTHTDVSLNVVLVFLVVLILCNVLFMGFIKFYRRFTLENYMALLTEKQKT